MIEIIKNVTIAAKMIKIIGSKAVVKFLTPCSASDSKYSETLPVTSAKIWSDKDFLANQYFSEKNNC